MPPPNLRPFDLIVDIGAREGDTCLWYFALGYRKFRLVEPNAKYFPNLYENTKELERLGCIIELKTEPFKPEHLDGAKFVKFDCEGCEYLINVFELSVPFVVEFHEKTKPNEKGIYNYVKAIGYFRGNC